MYGTEDAINSYHIEESQQTHGNANNAEKRNRTGENHYEIQKRHLSMRHLVKYNKTKKKTITNPKIAKRNTKRNM